MLDLRPMTREEWIVYQGADRDALIGEHTVDEQEVQVIASHDKVSVVFDDGTELLLEVRGRLGHDVARLLDAFDTTEQLRTAGYKVV